MRSLKLLTVAAIALCSSSALACGMPPKAGLSLADAMEKIEAPNPVVAEVVAPEDAEIEAPAEPEPAQEETKAPTEPPAEPAQPQAPTS